MSPIVILLFLIAAGAVCLAAVLVLACVMESDRRDFERQCREHEHLRAELGRYITGGAK